MGEQETWEGKDTEEENDTQSVQIYWRITVE